jgi:hypothetical protein
MSRAGLNVVRIVFSGLVSAFIVAPHWLWWPAFFLVALAATIDRR